MDLTEYTRDTMRGLKGIAVIVETLRPEAEADGLSMEDLHSDTVDKLMAAGILVLAQDDWAQTPGRPWLYVSVNTMKYLATHFFSVDVQLKQEVSLPRSPSIVTSCSTWEVGSIGFAAPQSLSDKIRSSVGAYVDHFIRDFKAVNLQLI